jgi:hypothetical protein
VLVTIVFYLIAGQFASGFGSRVEAAGRFP